jgi:hypothetical protein
MNLTIEVYVLSTQQTYERMWKEVAMAYIKVLLQHLCRGFKENHGNPLQDSWSLS